MKVYLSPSVKVNEIHLYPMCLAEFLRAMGERGLADLLDAGDAAAPLLSDLKENFIPLLRDYFDKFMPAAAVRTSMSGYREQDWVTNIPLWAVSCLKVQKE